MIKQPLSASSIRFIIYTLYALIAGVFVFAFSFNTSPFSITSSNHDTDIYQHMGLLILQGGTPYVDLYDNKGLIFYLFNALGIWISPQWGICLLQCIMMTCTLIVWDKLLDAIGTKYRLLYILSALIILFCYYGGGDLTEEFSLLFISIPLLYYFKSYYNHSAITPLQYFIVGICLGVITFVRVNNALQFLFFYLVAVIADIRNKKYIVILKNMAAALAGFSIVTIGCILTMAYIGGWQSLDDMFYWMFGVNFERLVFSVYSNWNIVYFCSTNIPPILLFIISAFIFKKTPNLLIPILLSQLATLTSVFLRPYPHYLGVLVPLYLIILAAGFQYKKWPYIAYFVLLISFNHRLVYDNVMRFRREVFLDRVWFKEAYDNFHNATIHMTTSEKEKIFNFENWRGLSLLNNEGIIQYNKSPFSYINEEFYSMTHKKSVDELPQWIIMSDKTNIDSANAAFISQHYNNTMSIGNVQWHEVSLIRLDTNTFNSPNNQNF